MEILSGLEHLKKLLIYFIIYLAVSSLSSITQDLLLGHTDSVVVVHGLSCFNCETRVRCAPSKGD